MRRVLAAYRPEGARARFHTTVRWLTCPFREVEALLPSDGAILDLGCGHGLLALWLATTSGERAVVGVDVDAAKLEVARRAAAAAGLGGRVQFEHLAGAGFPDDRRWDAIACVDVLYLLGPKRALDLVDDLVAALADGGTIVLKEMAPAPRWKVWLTLVQELFTTKVLGWTEGERLELVPVADLVGRLELAGLTTRTVRLDRRRLHPHVAVVGRRGPR